MRSLAAWTRESVLQLGPTFIKLGQLFSTRSDLFPSEFTEVCLDTLRRGCASLSAAASPEQGSYSEERGGGSIQ